MSDARHNLGDAEEIRAEALGVPGKRTFRLVVRAEHGSAVIGLEKEHLSALALAIQRLLREVPEGRSRSAQSPKEPSQEPGYDFKAASLGLAYDEQHGIFSVLAYDGDDAGKDTATVACSFTRARAEGLAEEALELVAAGRPICPLCERPIDPEGHMCPHSNGHKAIIDEL